VVVVQEVVEVKWIEWELVVHEVQKKGLCLVQSQIDMGSISHQIQLVQKCEFGV